MGFIVAVFLLIGGYAMAYYGASNLRNGGQGPGFFEGLGINSPISTPDSGGGDSGGMGIPNIGGGAPAPNGGFGFPGGGGILGGPIDYSGNPNVGPAPGSNSSPGQVTEFI